MRPQPSVPTTEHLAMTNEDHDNYEILIEKRLHGAITAAESEDLNAHLQSCAQCRLLFASLQQDEELMTTFTNTFADQFDWDQSERALKNGIAVQRQKNTLFNTLLIGSVALASWIVWRDGTGDLLENAILFTVVIAPMFALWIASRIGLARLVSDLATSGAEREAAYGAMVLRSERTRSIGIMATVATVVIGGFLSVTFFEGWLRAVGIFWVAFMILASYQLVWSRTARERSRARETGEQE